MNLEDYTDHEFKRLLATQCSLYNITEQPSIIPNVNRIIVIGDIHGDIEMTFKSLELAKVIDKNQKWIGGDTVVVQVGDQIDRCRYDGITPCHYENATKNDEHSDIRILKFFTKLHNQAQKYGGAVYSLLGNHELMNVNGDMRYVSYKGLRGFDNYKKQDGTIISNGMDARAHAFAPGNDLSNFLACTRQVALIIGSNLFVHAGILPHIAKKYKIILLAGLFEKDKEDKIYKAYVCVDENGLIAKYRKLSPFINKHISAGNEYCIFDLKGWKCSILICYDNNIFENVRAVKLLGAEIIFMPHVTMCTPSTRPGAGFVDPALWHNRHNDPITLINEFDSLKGRAWLMKWLPSRAYDNAVYVIFSNPIGMDDDQLKNGCSMIIDPFGDIMAECRTFDDAYVSAELIHANIEKAGGTRYLNARRPDMYKDIIGKDHDTVLKVAWVNK